MNLKDTYKRSHFVGANVKRILQERGLKQKKAAENCGYPEQEFSAMLNGRRIIKESDVFILSMGLDIPYEELFRTDVQA